MLIVKLLKPRLNLNNTSFPGMLIIGTFEKLAPDNKSPYALPLPFELPSMRRSEQRLGLYEITIFFPVYVTVAGYLFEENFFLCYLAAIDPEQSFLINNLTGTITVNRNLTRTSYRLIVAVSKNNWNNKLS